MLVIHKTQMDALNKSMRQRFVIRLRGCIRETFPDLEQQSGGAERLNEILDKLIARAEGYGLEEDLDVAVFVVLAFARPKQPADQPSYLHWTKPILEREESSGASKIGLIEFLLSDRAKTDPTANTLSTLCTQIRQGLYA